MYVLFENYHIAFVRGKQALATVPFSQWCGLYFGLQTDQDFLWTIEKDLSQHSKGGWRWFSEEELKRVANFRVLPNKTYFSGLKIL